MVKSYCVKEKKQTESVQPSGYKKQKNKKTKMAEQFFGVLVHHVVLKRRDLLKSGKLNSPSEGAGVVDTEN